MRIHEQSTQLLVDDSSAYTAPLVAGKHDDLLVSLIATTIASTMCEPPPPPTATTVSNGAARWQQLRRLMRPLIRGIRTHPVLPIPTSSLHSNDSDALLSDVAPGAAMLHKDFWLEALDTQHRYGFHLRAFHRVWKDTVATIDPRDASFFYWLDHGAGRTVELPECTRNALASRCVEYCDANARRAFEVTFVPPVTIDDETLAIAPVAVYTATDNVVETDDRSKWIFVVSLAGTLYVGRKRKGAFHHSSFVAGAPILAAGKLEIKAGRIVAIEPHSGHFKPTLRNLAALCCVLSNAGVDVAAIAFVRPKKWTSAWPFGNDRLPVHRHACGLNDNDEDDDDTDYSSCKSDSDDS